MTCPKISEYDVAAYVSDPRNSEWREFREHIIDCIDCMTVLASWTDLEGALRAGADTMTNQHPSADLLATYADSAEEIDAGQRAVIDRHLATCPACRTDLAALRAFDFSAAARLAEDSAREAAAHASGQAKAAPFAGLLSWLPRPTVWVPLAMGAAAVLAWLTFGGNASVPSSQPTESRHFAEDARTKDSTHGGDIAPIEIVEVPEPLDRSRPDPSSSDRSGIGLPNRPDDDPLLASEDASDSLQSAPQGSASGAEDAPTRPGDLASAIPVTREIIDSAATGIDSGNELSRKVSPERTTDDGSESVLRDEIMLAALDLGDPRYAIPLRRAGLPFDVPNRDVAMRSQGAATQIVKALAPPHVGRTVVATPTLWWYLARDTSDPIHFLLADGEAIDPLIELALEGPTSAGFHSVDLAQFGVQLVPGKLYEWSVTVIADADRPSSNPRSFAAVVRLEKDPVESELRAEKRGHAYARDGIWYDALAAISQRAESYPERTELVRQRQALLESAQIDLPD